MPKYDDSETFARLVGKNIRRIRRREGLSQKVCAKRADVHFTTVGFIERGRRIPRADTLVEIAGAIGCSPCDFLDGLM